MPRLIFLSCLVFIASCNNNPETNTGASENYNKTDSVQMKMDQVDSLLQTQENTVATYAEKFTPKDVFFALVTRQNASDTLPRIIKENYTPAEIVTTERKIVVLKGLTGLQLLTLYREVSPNKVIYGTDDREPVFYDMASVSNTTGNAYLDDAKSVVAIIDKFYMHPDGNGNYIINPKGIYKNLQRLCETERFANEPVASHCTGFCVSPNKIVTASHCLDKNTMRSFYYVFDYMADENGKFSNIIPQDRVYEAIEYVNGTPPGDTNTDYAVIKVNKTIPNYRIARVNPAVNYASGDTYHVIGCPMGIPMKIALRATIRKYSDPNFFVINSDTYGGNSGSPVFNSNNHMVEGILVKGERDFSITAGTCKISYSCPFNGCRGEDVSKNTQFINYIH